MNADDAIAVLNALEPWELANMAGAACVGESAERFYADARDTFTELAGQLDPDDWTRELVEDYSGMAAQVADDAPDVYTTARWQQFVGTGAWNETPETMGAPADMTAAAGVCLYLIAARLVSALAALLVAAYDEGAA